MNKSLLCESCWLIEVSSDVLTSLRVPMLDGEYNVLLHCSKSYIVVGFLIHCSVMRSVKGRN